MMQRWSCLPLVCLLACFNPPSQGGAGGGSPGTAGGGSATAGGGAGGSGLAGGSGAAGGTAGAAGGVATNEPIALALQPAVLTVPIGSTARFQVFAENADGTLTDVTATAQLTAAPGGVVELGPGAVKALAAGNARLTAKLGALETVGAITVPTAALQSISLAPAQATLGLGQSQKLSVLGRLADETVLDVTSTATLTSSSGAVSIDATGLARALSAGDVTITARVGTFTATAQLTVRTARVTALAIEPRMPSLAIGASQALRATATYEDQSTAEVTLAAAWSSSNPAVSVSPAGVVLGASAGTAVVTATFSQATATVDVTVRPATLVAVTVLPATLTLPPRATQRLTAQGRWSDGATSDVTAQAQWSSSAPSIASISNAPGSKGEVSSLTAGAANLVARVGNVQGQAQLTITPAMLVSLTVRPASPTVRPNGGTVQLSVEGTYSDDAHVDLTSQATWSTADATLATVGNASAGGLVTGHAAGSVSIRAAVGSVSASVMVSVARPMPDSIEVAPANQTVEAGQQLSLRAMARYSDGAIEDVSELCTWSAMPAAVATVSNAPGTKGRVRGVANGMASVQAVLGALTASTMLTVSPPMLTQLAVFPPTLRTAAGIYSRVEATATFSDGSGGGVTGQAQWTSSNPAVARVMVYQQYYAYVESVAPGTATITASAGGLSATIAVTVTNAALTSLQLSPAAPSIARGETRTVSASGVFSDLTTEDLTYTAAWSSSDPSIVAVGQDAVGYQIITGLQPGTATLTANYGGVTGTTTVTVTSATLQTIQVTPFTPRLPVGFSTFLRATGIYSDNTTQELTYRVSWSSSAPATAAVSPYGELQPLAAGMATVTANLDGVSGSTVVTVSSATLSSIAVTPNMGSVAIGVELPFAATGTFSDTTTMDVTPYVTWLSSNRAVADVANAWPYQGSAKGLSVGMCTITAVRGGVTGTAGLTVH